ATGPPDSERAFRSQRGRPRTGNLSAAVSLGQNHVESIAAWFVRRGYGLGIVSLSPSSSALIGCVYTRRNFAVSNQKPSLTMRLRRQKERRAKDGSAAAAARLHTIARAARSSRGGIGIGSSGRPTRRPIARAISPTVSDSSLATQNVSPADSSRPA